MLEEKMKFGIISVILLVTITVVRGDDEKNKYTTKYDNIDVDAIIRNPRLLKNYVDCVLEKGHCTPEGNELKKNVPDAIQTDCSKCSEKQKQLTDKVLGYLIDNEKEFWKSLQEKYDPSENVPDAIQTDCSKCSEKQKQLTDKVLGYVIDNEKEFWKSLQEKYDPSGDYTKNYQNSKKV